MHEGIVLLSAELAWQLVAKLRAQRGRRPTGRHLAVVDVGEEGTRGEHGLVEAHAILKLVDASLELIRGARRCGVRR